VWLSDTGGARVLHRVQWKKFLCVDDDDESDDEALFEPLRHQPLLVQPKAPLTQLQLKAAQHASRQAAEAQRAREAKVAEQEAGWSAADRAALASESADAAWLCTASDERPQLAEPESLVEPVDVSEAPALPTFQQELTLAQPASASNTSETEPLDVESGASVIVRFMGENGQCIGPEVCVPLVATPTQLQQILNHITTNSDGERAFRIDGGAEVATTLGTALHASSKVSTERTVNIVLSDLVEHEQSPAPANNELDTFAEAPKHEQYIGGDGRFDSVSYNKAHATWRQRKSRALKAVAAGETRPRHPKPHGRVPVANGALCTWDGEEGCWRAASGDRHDVDRAARGDAYFAAKVVRSIAEQKQRRADAERIDAEARLLVEAQSALSSHDSHCALPLIADERPGVFTPAGVPCYDLGPIFLKMRKHDLFRWGETSMVVKHELGSIYDAPHLTPPWTERRIYVRVVLSDDCRRRTSRALKMLGYCAGGVSDDDLCVRRSYSYWDHVDKLLVAHGRLSLEQYAYHLRASLKTKINEAMSAMCTEMRAEAEVRAVAELKAGPGPYRYVRGAGLRA
jgi:hypothetical protein